MSKKSSQGMTKLLIAGGVLVLIIVAVQYINTGRSNSNLFLPEIDQAFRAGQVKAYGVNECFKPVTIGTSMLNTVPVKGGAIRDYFSYHFVETMPTQQWVKCAIFPMMQTTLNYQSATVLQSWVNMMETSTTDGYPCDVPEISDVPATYCGYTLDTR